MPQITIRTTIDGQEEVLSEYMCDWPNCPEVAVHVVGGVSELRVLTAVCAQHAARLANRRVDKS